MIKSQILKSSVQLSLSVTLFGFLLGCNKAKAPVVAESSVDGTAAAQTSKEAIARQERNEDANRALTLKTKQIDAQIAEKNRAAADFLTEQGENNKVKVTTIQEDGANYRADAQAKAQTQSTLYMAGAQVLNPMVTTLGQMKVSSDQIAANKDEAKARRDDAGEQRTWQGKENSLDRLAKMGQDERDAVFKSAQASEKTYGLALNSANDYLTTIETVTNAKTRLKVAEDKLSAATSDAEKTRLSTEKIAAQTNLNAIEASGKPGAAVFANKSIDELNTTRSSLLAMQRQAEQGLASAQNKINELGHFRADADLNDARDLQNKINISGGGPPVASTTNPNLPTRVGAGALAGGGTSPGRSTSQERHPSSDSLVTAAEYQIQIEAAKTRLRAAMDNMPKDAEQSHIKIPTIRSGEFDTSSSEYQEAIAALKTAGITDQTVQQGILKNINEESLETVKSEIDQSANSQISIVQNLDSSSRFPPLTSQVFAEAMNSGGSWNPPSIQPAKPAPAPTLKPVVAKPATPVASDISQPLTGNNGPILDEDFFCETKAGCSDPKLPDLYTNIVSYATRVKGGGDNGDPKEDAEAIRSDIRKHFAGLIKDGGDELTKKRAENTQTALLNAVNKAESNPDDFLSAAEGKDIHAYFSELRNESLAAATVASIDNPLGLPNSFSGTTQIASTDLGFKTNKYGQPCTFLSADRDGC